jgi:hypothetical protein
MAYGRTPLSDAEPTRRLPSNPCNTNNGPNPRVPSACLDAPVQETLLAYNSDPSVPIRAIAHSFGIAEFTLRHRIRGRASRSCAHEYRQILSESEEKTLARWITHLTATGYNPKTLKNGNAVTFNLLLCSNQKIAVRNMEHSVYCRRPRHFGKPSRRSQD